MPQKGGGGHSSKSWIRILREDSSTTQKMIREDTSPQN